MSKQKQSTNKLLAWFDQNFLAFLAGFLIIFIPLYPKIPLADIIPGYIVRLRLEDFLILFAFIIWVIQVFRRRVTWHPLLTKIIGAYIIIGFLSSLSAIFVTKTVPQDTVHVLKLYLHWIRRIEYFSLFFIFYSSIKSLKQLKLIILSLIPLTMIISLYGYGQKYLYWPVYSTMNREFSKGVKLYLTEHARVPSTFGGHYDAAAWLMIILTIVFAFALVLKKPWQKLAAFTAFVMGFWLLILTASRTSFIAYLVAITVLMGLFLLVKNWKWVLMRWVGVIIFSLVVMLSFGDLSERYKQVLKLDIITEKYAAALFQPKVARPANITDLEMVTTPSDQTPVAEKPDETQVKPPPKELPGDVYEDIPDEKKIATAGGETIVYVERTFSDNAYKYGLSAAIRLDALWPRAIQGFMSNPLLGSGYSTLTKEAVEVFTEAESTDNDFLRALGETGLLGFITYFGAILTVMFLAVRFARQVTDPLIQAFALSFVAASVGLLLNAIYIDVYEASKVASTYWALAGLILAIPLVAIPKTTKKTTDD